MAAGPNRPFLVLAKVDRHPNLKAHQAVKGRLGPYESELVDFALSGD
jgi:hypothetical protein